MDTAATIHIRSTAGARDFAALQAENRRRPKYVSVENRFLNFSILPRWKPLGHGDSIAPKSTITWGKVLKISWYFRQIPRVLQNVSCFCCRGVRKLVHLRCKRESFNTTTKPPRDARKFWSFCLPNSGKTAVEGFHKCSFLFSAELPRAAQNVLGFLF